MIAGHTKISCDSLFGMIKKKTRVHFVSCLDDVEKCVTLSAPANNVPQLVGNEDGSLNVQYYEWKLFLPRFFRKVPHLTSFHCFDIKGCGEVEARLFSDDQHSTKLSLMKLRPHNLSMPDPIYPTGMTLDRRKYLYEKLLPFCRAGTEDLVTPKPTEIL